MFYFTNYSSEMDENNEHLDYPGRRRMAAFGIAVMMCQSSTTRCCIVFYMSVVCTTLLHRVDFLLLNLTEELLMELLTDHRI